MPQKSLRYGFKISLHVAQKGYIVATNNVLLPVGTLPEADPRLRFENAVFQIATGDGEASSDLAQRRIGEEIRFGQAIRLIHMTSNSLLCESRRLRATREKANQKVTLSALNTEDAKGSRWRVLPRYKVRSEGEKVCDRDFVLLKSLSGDTTLHVAGSADASTDQYFEVNSGHIGTGVTIHAYDTEGYDPNMEARELRGGDCLLLYHKEERAFLVGEKTDHCVFEPEIQTRELGRMTGVGYPDVYNSNSMFVVEFDDLYAGGFISFGRGHTYRLKSLSTGKYLCVRHISELSRTESSGNSLASETSLYLQSPSMANSPRSEKDEADDADIDPNYVVVLVEDMKNPGTRVCFHQATDDPSTIAKKRSRAFIEFLMNNEGTQGNGLWLSVGATTKNHRFHRGSQIIRMEMDTSRPSKEIACAHNTSYKDGMELIKVRTTEYQELNGIIALIPPIRRLVVAMGAGECPSVQLVQQVRENIVTLAKTCTSSLEEDVLKREGTAMPVAQNRLVDQGVPQLCLQLVDAICSEKSVVPLDRISELQVIPQSEAMVPAGATPLKNSDFQTAWRSSASGWCACAA